MKLTKLLASFVLIGMSAAASAEVVTQLSPGSLSLNVLKNCVINTGLAGTGPIGGVTPAFGVSGDYESSADEASFNCTNTTSYSVDVNKQLLGLTGTGGNIPYTAKIYSSSKLEGANGTPAAIGNQVGAGVGGGMSSGQTQKVAYKYKILEADYLDVPPGSYSDLTLALKITY